MKRSPNEEYLEKAKRLSKAETERLLSRARNKLLRRLEDQKLSALEAVAIQLEIEDEDLQEWRNRWAEIKSKVVGEPKAEAKGVAKPKSKAEAAAAKPAAKGEAKAKSAGKSQRSAGPKGKAS